MTTYPLSEPATIYAAATPDKATPETRGQGTLEECAEIIAGLSPGEQKAVSIRIDTLAIELGPQEIAELLEFLRTETPGLSNTEVTNIKSSEP